MKQFIVSIFLLFFCLFIISCIDWDRPVVDLHVDEQEDKFTETYLDIDYSDSPCPYGQLPCGTGGECVDVISNHTHCGQCGRECSPVEVCSLGACSLECPSGLVGCHGSCVNLNDDIHNCGECGHECIAGIHADPFCEDRICTVVCHPGWSDMDGDKSCETNCVPQSQFEQCNGIDDNCDGRVDEGFECRKNETVSCQTSCDTPGTGLCGSDCRKPAPHDCTPPAEICNGVDDNCNNRIDEVFECSSGESMFCETSCGTSGMKICSAACMWSECIPPPELCNGIDDDCNGICDNGFECCRGSYGSCTTGCGSRGSMHCSNSCQWEVCIPPSESCNGMDDNCNGEIDEDFWKYRCPSSGNIYQDSNICNSNCFQTQNCNSSTPPVSVSGNVSMQTTDCEGFSVYTPATRFEGSGNLIRIYRKHGCYGSEEFAGSLTLSGATVSGNVSMQTTDCEGFSVYTPATRFEGSGNLIRIYRKHGCYGSEEFAGSLTLSGIPVYSCPLGSYSCTGSPPTCSAPLACERVTVCP